MSAPLQTVNFVPPAFAVSTQAQLTSLSGSVVSLNTTQSTQATQIVSLSGSVSLLNFRSSYLFPTSKEVYSVLSNRLGGTSGFDAQRDASNSLQSFFSPIQENIYTTNVPLTFSYTGTELFTGSNVNNINYNVYKYTTTTGTLSFTGGQIYASTFTGANMVTCAPGDSELYVYTKPFVEDAYRIGVSYFTKRGYAMPDEALIPQDRSLYLSHSAAGAVRHQVAFRPILDANNNIISANVVGLYHNFDSGFVQYGSYPPFNSSGTFRPYFINPSAVTIPVTRSYDTHQALVNAGTGSIFWDQAYKVLNINIPTGASFKVYDTNINPNNIPCIPTGSIQYFMNRFVASYAIVTKDNSNELSPTNFISTCVGLVQVSPTIGFTTTVVRDGVSTTYNANLSSEGSWFHNFAGMTLAPKNYGLPQGLKNLVWSWYVGYSNSNNIPDQPGQYIAPNIGDNPSTFLRELNGSTSVITSFDDPTLRGMVWDVNFISNPGYPETITTSVSTGANATFVAEGLPVTRRRNVFNHELMHAIQQAYGANNSTDVESQATALELDERVNLGNVGRRTSSYIRYLMTLYRGTWELFLEYYFTGYTNPNAYTNIASYGAAMFWDWMFRRIDPNRQVMRRHMEVMATKSLGPLLASEPDLMSLWNLQNDGSTSYFGYSAAGARIATNQALQELNGTNLKDVFADWCVASSLLRNNLSIPEQWRIKYPWWVYSASNPVDIKSLLVSPAGLTTNSEAAYFWDLVQNPTGSFASAGVSTITNFSNNIVLEPLYPWWPRASYSSATTTGSSGNTRNRPIPGTVTLLGATGPVYVDRRYVSSNAYATTFSQDLSDCTMLGFIIPDSFTGVQISVSAASTGADVRAMVCRYTPDSGITGTFNYNGYVSVPVGGSQTLDTNGLKANPGYTKLVVANTTITDYGGWNNFLSKSYRFSANVTITQLT